MNRPPIEKQTGKCTKVADKFKKALVGISMIVALQSVFAWKQNGPGVAVWPYYDGSVNLSYVEPSLALFLACGAGAYLVSKIVRGAGEA